MTRADRLRAHVDAAANSPVVWGESDCTAFAAAWVATETGRPLALPAYGSRDEAERLIAAAGGLSAAWGEVLSRSGFAQTGAPALGDVGVIETTKGEVGVVFAAGGFALWRSEAGVMPIRPARVVAAWAVPGETE